MKYRLPEDFVGGAKEWGPWERPDGVPTDDAASNDLCRRIVEISFHAVAASHGEEAFLDMDSGEIEADTSEEQALQWFDIALESVWTALDDGMIQAIPLGPHQ